MPLCVIFFFYLEWGKLCNTCPNTFLMVVGLWTSCCCVYVGLCVNNPTFPSINAWAVNSPAVRREWSVCWVVWAMGRDEPAASCCGFAAWDSWAASLRCHDWYEAPKKEDLIRVEREKDICFLLFPALRFQPGLNTTSKAKHPAPISNALSPVVCVGKPNKWKAGQNESFVLLHCAGSLPGAIFLFLCAS